MTDAIYLDDMESMGFDAEVVSVSDDTDIVLDRTCFYPRSGGVANDTGHLIRDSDGRRFEVSMVRRADGGIVHTVSEPGLVGGDRVHGELDEDRRRTLMRYHTAAHVLSGVFWNEGGVKIGGNDLDVNGGRMDFTLEDFDPETIRGYVDVANRLIAEDLPVTTYEIGRAELESDPGMTKLLMGLPEGIGTVRIVQIGDYDRQPDGGCHVSSLGHIGRIELTKTKNKGRNNRRMYFVLDDE